MPSYIGEPNNEKMGSNLDGKTGVQPLQKDGGQA